jgi:YgiT-type zinc finger domain-containing protein
MASTVRSEWAASKRSKSTSARWNSTRFSRPPGETRPGKTTVTLQRGETTVLIKGVPAEIRQDCGEYYLSEDVARRVYREAEAAAGRQAEVEILHYAA